MYVCLEFQWEVKTGVLTIHRYDKECSLNKNKWINISKVAELCFEKILTYQKAVLHL